MNKKGHVLNAALLSVGLGVILGVDPTVPSPTGEMARSAGTKTAQLLVPVMLGALFPDVDTAFGTHRKTLHNLPILGVFLGYVYVFDNLHFVWIGVAGHYVLDVVGNRRGIALFYPLSAAEYGFPTGVTTSSRYAGAVTVVITGLELAALAGVHFYLFSLDVSADLLVEALGF